MATGYPGMPTSVAGYGTAPQHQHSVMALLPGQPASPATTQDPSGGGGMSGEVCDPAVVGHGQIPPPPVQPSPSPTGSVASSRSMSPAVVPGQQPGMPVGGSPDGVGRPQEVAGGQYRPPPPGYARPPYPQPAGYGAAPAAGHYLRGPAGYGYQHQQQQPPPSSLPPPPPPPHYTQHWSGGQQPAPPPPVSSPSGRAPAHHQPAPPAPGAPSSYFLRHQLQQRAQYSSNNGTGVPAAPPPSMPPPAANQLQLSAAPHQLQQPPRPASRGSDPSQPAPAPHEPGHIAVIGPDGMPLVDDGSQQSTLSSTSANSEERRSPRPRALLPPSLPAHHHSAAPAAPHSQLSSLLSPGGGGGGAAGATSASGGGLLTAGYNYSQQRPPHSENGATNPTSSPPAWTRQPSNKAESLSRLYEMDNSPERRDFITHLLTMMEQRGSPVLQCPTVAKQPLDLYKFYKIVQQRGGFIQVSKDKSWKEIAGQLGVGGSSSGSYTLRKHYMKILIFYEYLVDRGGEDPAPVLAKYESRRNRSKRDQPPPPPAPPPDGYSGAAAADGYSGGYPEYAAAAPAPQQQPPPPHGYTGYPAASSQAYQPGYSQYGSGGAGTAALSAAPPPAPAPYQPSQQQYNRPYTAAAAAGEYARYQGPPPGPPTYGTRNPYGEGGGPTPPAAIANGTGPAPAAAAVDPNSGQPYSQRYAAPAAPGTPSAAFKAAPPRPELPPTAPAGAATAAAPAAPPPPPPHQSYPGWRPYGQFGGGGGGGSGAVASSDPRAPYPSVTAHWTGVGGPVTPPTARQPALGRRPPEKEQPVTPVKAPAPLTFPAGSVEATAPTAARRRRRGRRQDVAPVDGWRLTLALRCGQLAQSCWALDVLQILSFDDRSVAWLDLPRMPGLLPALLDHFQQCLTTMFACGLDGAHGGWYEERPDREADAHLKISVMQKSVDAEDRVRMLSGDDYTRVSRRGLPVLLSDEDAERAQPPPDGRASALSLLDDAGDEHLLTHIRVETSRLQFSRRLRAGKIADDGQPDTEGILETKYDGSPTLEGFGMPDFFLKRVQKRPSSVAHGGDSKDHVGFSPKKMRATDVESIVCDTIKSEPVDNRVLEVTNDVVQTIKLDEKEVIGIRNEEKGSGEAGDVDQSTEHKHGASLVNGPSQQSEDTPSQSTKAPSQRKLDADAAAQGKNEVQSGTQAMQQHFVKAEPVDNPSRHSDSTQKSDTACHDSDVPVRRAEGSPEQTERPELPSATPRLQVRDPAGVLSRLEPDEQEECVQFDEPSLCLVTETQEGIGQRCLAISTVLRNLSFVPGNEAELCSAAPLSLLADLVLLHHRHPARPPAQHSYDRDEDADFEQACAAVSGHRWWADHMPVLHENTLVTLANVAGQLRLDELPGPLVRTLLQGLLHWLLCEAAYGTDPAARSPTLATSLQLLALEALCRLCVRPANVDLLAATPAVWQLRRLCRLLAGWTAHAELAVRRELALTLLHFLSGADERVCVLAAHQPQLVPTLVRFIDAAEQAAMGVASTRGVNALRDQPDLMGTSVDLLSRAAQLLVWLAPLAGSRPALLAREYHLLQLVTSQILDQRVAALLAQVLHRISQPPQPA